MNFDLLIIDDFMLHPITNQVQLSVLFDVSDRRVDRPASTIVCSQRSPEGWNAVMVGDAALSDVITTRVTKDYTVAIEVSMTN